MSGRLTGKVALITAAGQGIGRQATHALASVGASLVCVDNREDLAKEIAAEVGGVPCVADATKREDADAAVALAVLDLSADLTERLCILLSCWSESVQSGTGWTAYGT